MALQFAVLDQRRDRRLHREIALDVQERSDGGDSLPRRVSDNVAEAEARREDLRQRADVNDHAAGSALASGSTGRPS